MQRPPRYGFVRVEALDEQDVLGRHAVLVEPSVVRVVADDPRLAHKVVLGHLGAHEVSVGHGSSIGHGDGVLENGLNRPPHVDDLVTPLDQLIGLVGELPA